MTEVLARVLGKNPQTTIVIIEEVETKTGALPVSRFRKAQAEA